MAIPLRALRMKGDRGLGRAQTLAAAAHSRPSCQERPRGVCAAALERDAAVDQAIG